MAGAQALPPVRPLGPVLATSSEPLGSVSHVRALSNGSVIVNDITGRRVVMFDSSFTHFKVVADSTNATGEAYSSRLGGLIAYRGDTTLFVDPSSYSMFVIDPSGKIVATMAIPLPKDANQLIGGPNGTPGFDPQGRLVFRARNLPVVTQLQRESRPGPSLAYPESSIVVRIDLKTRRIDTLAAFRIPTFNMTLATDEKTGASVVRMPLNPIPWVDDWALLADGTVGGVVRPCAGGFSMITSVKKVFIDNGKETYGIGFSLPIGK
jgi:hypothetical protein